MRVPEKPGMHWKARIIRKMKRRLCILLLLFTAIILTACGNKVKEVPESEIQDVVDDYFYENTMVGYIAHDYSAIHNWDSETKTDTVQIKAITEYEYGYLVAECECKYQYDRSSDLWNLKRIGHWSEYVDYSEKWNEQTLTGAINDCTYSIDVHHIDLENKEVLWDIDVEGYAYVNGTEYSTNFEGTETSVIEDAGTKDRDTISGGDKQIPYHSIRVGNGEGYVNLYVFISVFGIHDMFFLYLS